MPKTKMEDYKIRKYLVTVTVTKFIKANFSPDF